MDRTERKDRQIPILVEGFGTSFSVIDRKVDRKSVRE